MELSRTKLALIASKLLLVQLRNSSEQCLFSVFMGVYCTELYHTISELEPVWINLSVLMKKEIVKEVLQKLRVF